MSRGDRVKAYVWGATILILLLLAISLGISGESKSDSTVVASSVQSPTAIPKRPTRVATLAPTAAPVLEATKAPSPTPTVREETNQNRPTGGSDSTGTSTTYEIATLADVLSQAQKSDAIIFSSQTAKGWGLTIAIPANGVQASLQKGVPTDPAPALSPEGDRIAYLDSAPTGHVIWIFNLRNGHKDDFPLPESKGMPLNLAWKSSDTILVTSQLSDEPQIYQLDLGSGDTGDFLPPWSANPSVSKGGEMVYVVPFEDNRDDLGIVLADEDGEAMGPYILYATSSENFPSFDPTAEFVAYTLSESDVGIHSLGISRRSHDDSFTSVPLQVTFLSSTPIRTAWVHSDRLVVGTCSEGSCEIILCSLSSPAQQTLIKSTETISLGNIVYRST